MSSTQFIIVFVTTANKAEAEKISQVLLQEKLIACANIINPVKSFFHWKGSVDCTEECMIIMKSRLDLFSSLETQVKALHSYDVPEILALPIVEGSVEYLNWMSESLK